MKRIVFISHSSADREIAERVCAYLEKHGVGCWMAPRDVTPGKNYGAAIVDAIDECQVFVLLLSSRSNASRQVVREVERAASADSVILPFRIEDVQPSRDIAFYVSAAHWLDATKQPVDKQFGELLTAIRNWQKTESGTEQTSAPAPSQASVPPPLPTPTSSVTTSPTAHAGRGFPVWPIVISAAVVVLGLGSLLAYKFLNRQPVKPAIVLQIPTPTPTPFLATPEPTATAAEPVVAETSPIATETPPPPPPLVTPPPMRLRPGERFHPTPVPESTAIPTLPSYTSPAPPPANPPAPGTMKGPLVREVAASSQFSNEFRANLAFDSNVATAWVPKGRAIGQSLLVNFKSPAVVRSVSILNGGGRDEGNYPEGNRIRTLRIVLSDGTNQVLNFKDEMKMQRFELKQPVTATSAKFEIVSVFPGKTKKGGIAEIAFNEEDR